MPHKDPQQRKLFERQYYKDHREAFLRRAKARRAGDLAKRRAFLLEAKNKPCADCGLRYPYYVMDFDHREPAKKSFTVAVDGVRVGIRKLQQELDKCDVVCSNCHRERTYQRAVEGRVSETTAGRKAGGKSGLHRTERQLTTGPG